MEVILAKSQILQRKIKTLSKINDNLQREIMRRKLYGMNCKRQIKKLSKTIYNVHIEIEDFKTDVLSKT